MGIFGRPNPRYEGHRTTIHNDGIELHVQAIVLESQKVDHNPHSQAIYRNKVGGPKIDEF